MVICFLLSFQFEAKSNLTKRDKQIAAPNEVNVICFRESTDELTIKLENKCQIVKWLKIPTIQHPPRVEHFEKSLQNDLEKSAERASTNKERDSINKS